METTDRQDAKDAERDETDGDNSQKEWFLTGRDY